MRVFVLFFLFLPLSLAFALGFGLVFLVVVVEPVRSTPAFPLQGFPGIVAAFCGARLPGEIPVEMCAEGLVDKRRRLSDGVGGLSVCLSFSRLVGSVGVFWFSIAAIWWHYHWHWHLRWCSIAGVCLSFETPTVGGMPFVFLLDGWDE